MADQGETPTPSGLRDELAGLPIGEMTKSLLAEQERQQRFEFVTVTHREISIRVPRAVAEMTLNYIQQNYDRLLEEQLDDSLDEKSLHKYSKASLSCVSDAKAGPTCKGGEDNG